MPDDVPENPHTEPGPPAYKPPRHREPPRSVQTVPPDRYAVMSVRPRDVRRIRPTWSTSRCRRWLIDHEQEFRERLQEFYQSQLEYLVRQTPTINRTLRRERRMFTIGITTPQPQEETQPDESSTEPPTPA